MRHTDDAIRGLEHTKIHINVLCYFPEQEEINKKIDEIISLIKREQARLKKSGEGKE